MGLSTCLFLKVVFLVNVPKGFGQRFSIDCHLNLNQIVQFHLVGSFRCLVQRFVVFPKPPQNPAILTWIDNAPPQRDFKKLSGRGDDPS